MNKYRLIRIFNVIIVIFIISSSIAKAQVTFEGKIVYIQQFTGKKIGSPQVIDTVTLFIKDKMLKRLTTYSPKVIVYYLNGNEYWVDEHTQSITFNRSKISTLSRNEDINNSLRETKYKKKIGKYKCKKYMQIYKVEGETIYKSIWISNQWNVLFSYFDELYKGKGIVIRTRESNSSVIVIKNLLEINPVKLDSTIFKLPDYPIKEKDMEKLSKAYLEEREK